MKKKESNVKCSKLFEYKAHNFLSAVSFHFMKINFHMQVISIYLIPFSPAYKGMCTLLIVTDVLYKKIDIAVLYVYTSSITSIHAK